MTAARAARVARHAPPAALAAATGTAAAMVAVVAATRDRGKGDVLLLGATGAVALLAAPELALVVLLAVAVLAEADAQAFLGQTSALYRSVLGLPVSPIVILLGLACAAVGIAALRRRADLRLPGRATVPLLLFALAIPPAALTGYLAGADRVLILAELLPFVALLTVPILVSTLLTDDHRIRLAVDAALVLAGVKAVEGLLSWGVGTGRHIGTATITYYEPTPLWLLALAVFFVVGALASNTRIPRPAMVVGLLSLATIVLSLRRGFWLATSFGMLACLLVASGRRGRFFLALGALALSLTAAVTLRSGGATDTSNVALERARSVATPQELTGNAEDRYRLDEERNVWSDIRAHPLAGLGLAVPWTGRYPLPLEHPDGRLYTHLALSFAWLKLGVLGAAGYVGLIVVTAAMGTRVWRRHDDPIIRLAGLATGVGAVALAIVELTASFTGASPRMTIALCAAIGWLAAAERSTAAGDGRMASAARNRRDTGGDGGGGSLRADGRGGGPGPALRPVERG